MRNGQYALGAALHYDQLGFERKYKADLDFAFRVHVRGPEHRLSFGLRAGLLHHEVQPGNYRPDDALPPDMVLDQVYRSTVPNASFGIHAYGRRYFAGISFPYLLSARGNGPEDVVFNHSEQQQFRRVLVSAGGVFGREYSRVKVKPSVLYSYASHAPFDLDINLNLLLIDRIWIGGSYRIGGDRSDGKGASLVAVCKFKATQQLEIGYAYDHTLSGLGSLSGGSHEIMMSFELHRERSHLVTPRYIRYF